jgi:ATP-dependent RNA helicase DDX49/DBP8
LCRELAYQTVDQFEVLGTGTGIRCSVVVGGMDQHAQCLDLQTRPHIVVASPGRLAEIFKQASDLAAAFKRTAVLVLDEADRILEDTFLEPLKAILGVCDFVPSLVSGWMLWFL